MPRVEFKALPPAEAVRFFRDKGFRVSFAWQDTWQAEHQRAFTVAKAMRLDVLTDIKGAMDQAIAEGRTFRQFQDDLTPQLQRNGWWGRKRLTDPVTGERRIVQLGSPRRLRTIFDVNMRTSYAAGRWERIERLKARRPWLRYMAVLDARTRPKHRAWHGTVLPVDHGFWSTHTPPNGWRCRCTVQQLSTRDLKRFGFTPSRRAPPARVRAWRNPRTGHTLRVPEGIDPGWGYNVGKIAARRARGAGLEVFAEKVERAAGDLARAAVADLLKDPLFRAHLAGAVQNDIPVAILGESLARAIGARAKAVRLSQDTSIKQAAAHADLAPADYRRIQRMLDEGEVVKQGPRHLLVMIEDGGARYLAVVKTTRDGRELFAVSYHRLRPDQAGSLRGRGRIIRRGK